MPKTDASSHTNSCRASPSRTANTRPHPSNPPPSPTSWRRVAEAHIQHESLNQATSPLALRHIHLDKHGVIRLDNLAIAGPRTPDQSVRDITTLGSELPALVADGKPGATRLLTLLGWMRGEGLDAPISWPQVREFCTQIEQQLADPAPAPDPAPQRPAKRSKPSGALIAASGVIALATILGLALKFRPKPPESPPKITLPGPLLVPAGTHPTPDGTTTPLPAFRIAPHEVTIRQYAKFLSTLETLSENHLEHTFDHKEQPDDKTSHIPDDWDALLAAAKSNGSWNGRPVTLDTPVVGVDWWDAAAYAEWKKGRLPTQEEWFAGLRLDLENPSSIEPSGWIPVTARSADRTPKGLLGMAGSVSEWTLERPPTPPTLSARENGSSSAAPSSAPDQTPSAANGSINAPPDARTSDSASSSTPNDRHAIT